MGGCRLAGVAVGAGSGLVWRSSATLSEFSRTRTRPCFGGQSGQPLRMPPAPRNHRDVDCCRCDAGHPPILRCRLDEYAFLDLAGGPQQMIGVEPERRYRYETKQLRPGTTLLFYTDGLVENRGQHLDDGMMSLLNFTRQHPNLPPQSLIDEVLLWRLMQGPTSDDMAVLAVRLE